MWKKISLVFICLLLCSGIGFGWYVSNYYEADSSVELLLQEGISNQTIAVEQDVILLNTDNNQVGLIFYPGAKVEALAYLPLMEQLRLEGINVFLVEMPFNLAFFDVNKADDIMASHPEIEHWIMAGHSLGGAFASQYTAKHLDEIDYLILLGAYLYGDVPIDRQITIYGTEDFVLNLDKITYDTNVVVLDGGNHAQFGNYGTQEGDGVANITAVSQQQQTVELILEQIPFLD